MSTRAPKVKATMTCDMMPNQFEGTINGVPFNYRARRGHYLLTLYLYDETDRIEHVVDGGENKHAGEPCRKAGASGFDTQRLANRLAALSPVRVERRVRGLFNKENKMKVVINNCFGGFGLSTEAMKRAISEGAAGISVHDEQEYTGGKRRGIGSETFHDAGDGYETGWIKDVLYREGKVYTHDDHKDEVRSDPVLVRIVEEMGAAANGTHASLKVVEVPDDVEWEISEYDGNEHIAETHRTWS